MDGDHQKYYKDTPHINSMSVDIITQLPKEMYVRTNEYIPRSGSDILGASIWGRFYSDFELEPTVECTAEIVTNNKPTDHFNIITVENVKEYAEKKELDESIITELTNVIEDNANDSVNAVCSYLLDHQEVIEELKQRLISEGVNQSIVEMLCEDLGEYVNNYLEEYDKFLTEYNSNRKDKIDLEELLTDREKLERFVELPDFNEYFVHDKDDIRGVKAEIRENIELIEKSNSSLIEKNNNLLAGMYNYLYSIITFFMIVDRQIERKTNDNLEDLLIEPLNIPRSETNFEKIPQTRKTKKDKIEGQLQIVTRYELKSAKSALTLAAMTYVLAAIGSLAELLRLLSILNSRRED